MYGAKSAAWVFVNLCLICASAAPLGRMYGLDFSNPQFVFEDAGIVSVDFNTLLNTESGLLKKIQYSGPNGKEAVNGCLSDDALYFSSASYSAIIGPEALNCKCSRNFYVQGDSLYFNQFLGIAQNALPIACNGQSYVALRVACHIGENNDVKTGFLAFQCAAATATGPTTASNPTPSAVIDYNPFPHEGGPVTSARIPPTPVIDASPDNGQIVTGEVATAAQPTQAATHIPVINFNPVPEGGHVDDAPVISPAANPSHTPIIDFNPVPVGLNEKSGEIATAPSQPTQTPFIDFNPVPVVPTEGVDNKPTATESAFVDFVPYEHPDNWPHGDVGQPGGEIATAPQPQQTAKASAFIDFVPFQHPDNWPHGGGDASTASPAKPTQTPIVDYNPIPESPVVGAPDVTPQPFVPVTIGGGLEPVQTPAVPVIEPPVITTVITTVVTTVLTVTTQAPIASTPLVVEQPTTTQALPTETASAFVDFVPFDTPENWPTGENGETGGEVATAPQPQATTTAPAFIDFVPHEPPQGWPGNDVEIATSGQPAPTPVVDYNPIPQNSDVQDATPVVPQPFVPVTVGGGVEPNNAVTPAAQPTPVVNFNPAGFDIPMAPEFTAPVVGGEIQQTSQPEIAMQRQPVEMAVEPGIAMAQQVNGEIATAGSPDQTPVVDFNPFAGMQ
eukprot:Colp12_sorted_trinity150504_noHs@28108